MLSCILVLTDTHLNGIFLCFFLMAKFNSVIYEVKNCIEDSTLMLS